MAEAMSLYSYFNTPCNGYSKSCAHFMGTKSDGIFVGKSNNNDVVVDVEIGGASLPFKNNLQLFKLRQKIICRYLIIISSACTSSIY